MCALCNCFFNNTNTCSNKNNINYCNQNTRCISKYKGWNNYGNNYWGRTFCIGCCDNYMYEQY